MGRSEIPNREGHPIPDRDLGRRTRGEELWLWRRRKGLTQEKTRARFGASEYAMAMAEKADAPTLPPRCRLREPTWGELCALARRRHGLGLDETARRHGCSRVTLLSREKRGAAGLVLWWQDMGYKFPETSSQ